MLTWPHARCVQLFLIEPGKLNQNAYIETFNGRFRDECLNENWFNSLQHARVVVETWRKEYNEERPKRSLGGLTSVAYAKTLIQKQLNYPPGLQSPVLLKMGGRRPLYDFSPFFDFFKH
jgi:putative transposase